MNRWNIAGVKTNENTSSLPISYSLDRDGVSDLEASDEENLELNVRRTPEYGRGILADPWPCSKTATPPAETSANNALQFYAKIIEIVESNSHTGLDDAIELIRLALEKRNNMLKTSSALLPSPSVFVSRKTLNPASLTFSKGLPPSNNIPDTYSFNLLIYMAAKYSSLVQVINLLNWMTDENVPTDEWTYEIVLEALYRQTDMPSQEAIDQMYHLFKEAELVLGVPFPVRNRRAEMDIRDYHLQVSPFPREPVKFEDSAVANMFLQLALISSNHKSEFGGRYCLHSLAKHKFSLHTHQYFNAIISTCQSIEQAMNVVQSMGDASLIIQRDTYHLLMDLCTRLSSYKSAKMVLELLVSQRHVETNDLLVVPDLKFLKTFLMTVESYEDLLESLEIVAKLMGESLIAPTEEFCVVMINRLMGFPNIFFLNRILTIITCFGVHISNEGWVHFFDLLSLTVDNLPENTCLNDYYQEPDSDTGNAHLVQCCLDVGMLALEALASQSGLFTWEIFGHLLKILRQAAAAPSEKSLPLSSDYMQFGPRNRLSRIVATIEKDPFEVKGPPVYPLLEANKAVMVQMEIHLNDYRLSDFQQFLGMGTGHLDYLFSIEKIPEPILKDYITLVADPEFTNFFSVRIFSKLVELCLENSSMAGVSQILEIIQERWMVPAHSLFDSIMAALTKMDSNGCDYELRQNLLEKMKDMRVVPYR